LLQVQNEINISHYSIERSADGLKFSEIGIVSSNQINEYHFNDLNPYSENNYYRIIGLENNGYKNYSKVVKVAFDKEEASITVTPNPIGNDRTLHMNFKNMLKGDYQLDIYDWSGRKVGGNTFNVKNENIKIKIAYTYGKIFENTEINRIINLNTKEEELYKFIKIIKTPIIKFTKTIDSLIKIKNGENNENQTTSTEVNAVNSSE